MDFCPKCGRQISGGGACPNCSPASPPPEDESFFNSLFDFNMKEMITPKIIRILYIIGVVVIGLLTIGALVNAIGLAAQYESAGAIWLSIILIPLSALLGVITLRVCLEVIMLLFKIYDKLKEIKP